MSEAEAPAEPRRAMVCMAHPDDAEFLCGGTVARLCGEGWQVVYVIATSGDKGTRDAEMDFGAEAAPTPAKGAAPLFTRPRGMLLGAHGRAVEQSAGSSPTLRKGLLRML